MDLCYEYGYGRSQDMVYQFEITQDTSIIVTLDPKGVAKTYFEIRTNCPPTGGDCIGYCRQHSSGAPYTSGILPLTAGTYYLILDSWIGGVGDSLECPPGAIAENEPCDEFLNDGCNMHVPAVETIACGDTLCGNIVADGNFRDTDWYSFTLDRPAIVTYTGTAEFPITIGFIEFDNPGTADCDYALGISPYAQRAPGDTITVSAELPAGEHWLFVATTLYDGLPCGTQNRSGVLSSVTSRSSG